MFRFLRRPNMFARVSLCQTALRGIPFRADRTSLWLDDAYILFDNLIWGGGVLRLMGILQGNDQKVGVIRHSERPSFENLPYLEWDNAGLTEKGTKAALRFGRVIASSQNPECLQVLWWGLNRCKLTAEAISEGAREEGCFVQGPSSIAFKSPIANREEYDKALRSSQWYQFITSWLQDRNSQIAMVPARQYAREIYRSLLAAEVCSPDKVALIVTHDLHILPLARLFFPSSTGWIDYLDGVIVKAEGNEVNIGFDGKIISVRRDDLLLK